MEIGSFVCERRICDLPLPARRLQRTGCRGGSVECAKRCFPKEWAGRTEEELKRISGIPTLTFCHKGRFMISTDTLEDAIKACRIARDEANSNNGFYRANIFNFR